MSETREPPISFGYQGSGELDISGLDLTAESPLAVSVGG